MALIRQFVCEKLKSLEQSDGDDSLEEQAKKYQEILDYILKVWKSSPERLIDCLKVYIAEAILNENVNLEVARQVFTNVTGKLTMLSDEISKLVSIFILDIKVQPRVTTFGEQVVLVRQHLAEIYERSQNWREAANVLTGIQLEFGNKQYATDFELQTYLKLTNLYLSDNDMVRATECIKEASLLQAKSENENLRIFYRLCDARVLDHQGEFIEAATRYQELSNETIVDGIEPLRSAQICAILAPAGKKKVWILKKLLKDQRCQKLPGYSILKKMHLGEIIKQSELNEFENLLHSHQKALTSVHEDTKVLELAVIENNLLSASKSNKSIPLDELSTLLETPLAKVKIVKKIAGQMILEGRMDGNIDEGNSTIQFDKNKTDENNLPATCQRQPAFEEKDQQKNFKPKFICDVWNIFDLDPKDSNFAICAVCNKRIGRRWGPRDMRRHFRNCHSDLDLNTYKKQNKQANAASKVSSENNNAESVGKDHSTVGRKRGRSEDKQYQCSNKIRKRGGLDGVATSNQCKSDETKELHDKACSKSDSSIHGVSNSKDKDCEKNEKRLNEEEKLEASIKFAIGEKKIEEHPVQQVGEMSSLNDTFDVVKTRDFDTSSMVSIKTPEYSEGSEIEMSNNKIQPVNVRQTIWKAIVRMENVAEFSMTAQEVTGSKTFDLMDKLPNSVNVVGRVKFEDVWKYIEVMKKIDSTKLIALKIEPAYEKDRASYSTLHTHLSTRSRLGVVNGLPVGVKDLYLMPVSGEVPPVLQSIVGGVVDESWLNVLLAIIVCKKPSTQEVVTIDKEEKTCSGKGSEGFLNDSFRAEASNKRTFSDASAPQLLFEKSKETCNPEVEAIRSEKNEERLKEESSKMLITEKCHNGGRSVRSKEFSLFRESKAHKSRESDDRGKRKVKKSRNEKILEILEKNLPNKLNVSKRQSEMNKRERRNLNIVVVKTGNLNLKFLSSTVYRIMGLWVKFKKSGETRNGDIILRVETVEEKKEILMMKWKLQSAGLTFYSDHTERERELVRWLKQKEKELIRIGVKAKKAYLGLYFDGYKWVWDESKGKLIKTDLRDFKSRR